MKKNSLKMPWGEQDELTGNPGIPMEVSLHALSDSLKRKTITLQGLLRGKKVSLLVDTGRFQLNEIHK